LIRQKEGLGGKEMSRSGEEERGGGEVYLL